MNTTTTKIAGEAMTKDQIRDIFMAHGFTIKEGQTDLKPYVYDAARALLASKQAVPQVKQWIAHWAGSNPYKGWSIRCGREEIIWFGETISSETVEGIVLAHNKCFDCEGTGCAMNCSGLHPAAPAQPCGDAEQADAPQWQTEETIKSMCRWRDLYDSINQVTAVLGCHGSINARDDRVMRLMECLKAMDGGEYTSGMMPPLVYAVGARHPYLPCPICNGVEGCDHTMPERRRASEQADEAVTDSPTSQIATITKDLIETLMLWNGQASAGLDISGLAGLRDELVELASRAKEQS